MGKRKYELVVYDNNDKPIPPMRYTVETEEMRAFIGTVKYTDPEGRTVALMENGQACNNVKFPVFTFQNLLNSYKGKLSIEDQLWRVTINQFLTPDSTINASYIRLEAITK